MKQTTANSYRITQFKKELWIDMSNKCDPSFWSYSVQEKRLFFLLVGFFIVLSLFYFNSYRQHAKIVRSKLEYYASTNANSLKKLQAIYGDEEIQNSAKKEVQDDTDVIRILHTDKNDKNSDTSEFFDVKSEDVLSPLPPQSTQDLHPEISTTISPTLVPIDGSNEGFIYSDMEDSGLPLSKLDF